MWIEKEDGWEVVLHSLMLGPSVSGPGPGGTIPWGGTRPEDGTTYIYAYQNYSKFTQLISL